MRLIRGLYNILPADRLCAATIGNFDGVHLGHQAILRRLTAKAAELGCRSTVILFEPQPREFFQPEQAPPRLTRLHEKIRLFEQCGIDQVLCLKFDASFAAQDADAFVRNILVDGLSVRYLMVGDDFKFGRQRQGDFEFLRQCGTRSHFEVERMGSYELATIRVSSTEIRNALSRGELSYAASMLGRPYSLVGRVIHGNKRGRTIGFPTANLKLSRVALPVNGVYSVKVRFEGVCYQGVANIGVRPTVDGKHPLLEVHLFEFGGDLYGTTIDVELHQYLRKEQKFENIQQLQQQIQRDVEQAVASFAR